jgi:hypothetical protein
MAVAQASGLWRKPPACGASLRLAYQAQAGGFCYGFDAGGVEEAVGVNEFVAVGVNEFVAVGVGVFVAVGVNVFVDTAE